MKQDPEFLPPDVAQLLARGTAMVEPPAGVRSRLRQRLTSSVAGPVAFAGSGITRWGQFQGLAATVGGSRAFIGFAGGLAGFLAGAATVLALRSTPAAVPFVPTAPFVAPSAVTTATEVPAPEAQAAPSRSPEVSASPPALPPALLIHRRAPARAAIEVATAEKTTPASPSIQSAPAPSTEVHWGLAAEGELLQKGRTAMVRGDSEGALAAVEEHASRFPQGKLAEEREALRIQVLVAEDRDPEARAALGAFRHAYPRSLLGPALEEAVVGKIR